MKWCFKSILAFRELRISFYFFSYAFIANCSPFYQSVRYLGYGLDDRGIGDRFPVEVEIFLLSTLFRQALTPTHLTLSSALEESFWGNVKVCNLTTHPCRAEGCKDHSNTLPLIYKSLPARCWISKTHCTFTYFQLCNCVHCSILRENFIWTHCIVLTVHGLIALPEESPLSLILLGII